jgi:nucleoside transporter
MEKYISLLGLLGMIFVAWLLSKNRKKVDFKLVMWGIGLQLVFAVIILKTPVGRAFFSWVNGVVVQLLGFTDKGADFVFGPFKFGQTIPGNSDMASFAFKILPTIIFFSSLMTVLYHLGIMQKIVVVVAKIMAKTMKTSGAESLSAAANIFVGQTEAPLVVKPFVNNMTLSELMAIMTGGMATVAGGVMAAYVGLLRPYFPNIAGHLMAASIMSAPAALVIAKIMIPETETPSTSGEIKLESEKIDANVIDAAARGAGEGLQLALNVGGMLLAFIALIYMLNAVMVFSGDMLVNRLVLSKNPYVPQFTEMSSFRGINVQPGDKIVVPAQNKGFDNPLEDKVSAAATVIKANFEADIPEVTEGLTFRVYDSSGKELGMASSFEPKGTKKMNFTLGFFSDFQPEMNHVTFKFLASDNPYLKGKDIILTASSVKINSSIATERGLLKPGFYTPEIKELNFEVYDSAGEKKTQGEKLTVQGGIKFNMEVILGILFAPFAFLMGVPWKDCTIIGTLLGEKIVLNEFYAYVHLGKLLASKACQLSPRSVVIASYALCGFANFQSIAIQIGGIGGIAPSRRHDLAKLGVRSMIAGSLAAFMTATIAGVFV